MGRRSWCKKRDPAHERQLEKKKKNAYGRAVSPPALRETTGLLQNGFSIYPRADESPTKAFALGGGLRIPR